MTDLSHTEGESEVVVELLQRPSSVGLQETRVRSPMGRVGDPNSGQDQGLGLVLNGVKPRSWTEMEKTEISDSNLERGQSPTSATDCGH